MGVARCFERGIELRCAVAVVVAVCAFPAAAQGTKVTYSNSTGLRVEAGPAELNNISVHANPSGGAYRVTDSGEKEFGVTVGFFTAGDGCVMIGPRTADCQRLGVSVMTIITLDGADHVSVNNDAPGDAFISGGSGDDELFSGTGFDAIDGGTGNDRLGSGSGNDAVNGGAGDDTLFNSADGVDVLSGGAGVDTLATIPGSTLDFGKQHNYSLDDVANDSDGEDTGENLKSDIENVVLPESDSARDVISGGPGANRLEGGGGNDTLSGGTPVATSTFSVQLTPITVQLLTLASAADDVLLGGPGDDTLNGQGGADQLDGGTGVDALNGGAGADTILARDSISDTVACGTDTDNADLDLRDPEPLDCENTDRGAVREGYNLGMPTGAVTRSARRVGVRVLCHRSVKRGCRGTLSVASGSGRGAAAAHYSLRRGRARTIVVSVPARSRRTLARRHEVTLSLESVERGSLGPKTTIRQLEVRLRR
jgi:hypothetical protein